MTSEENAAGKANGAGTNPAPAGVVNGLLGLCLSPSRSGGLLFQHAPWIAHDAVGFRTNVLKGVNRVACLRDRIVGDCRNHLSRLLAPHPLQVGAGYNQLQIYADAAKSVRVMALVVHPYIMGAPHRLNISAACSKSSARRAT